MFKQKLYNPIDISRTAVTVTKADMMGAAAYNAVALSPHTIPRNFDKFLMSLSDIIDKKFRSPLEWDPDFKVFDIDIKTDSDTVSQISKFCFDILKDIPEFVDWNRSDYEVAADIDVEDPNRQKYYVIEAKSTIPKADDFVDLNKFCDNMAYLLLIAHKKAS